MIAIETKYVGPTDNKPSRIIASTCNGQRLTISCGRAEDMAREKLGHDDTQSSHQVVAQALADKMGWTDRIVGGGTKRGYVFVFVPSLTAIDSCLPDLEHYAATHGPGPDRRLVVLKQSLQRSA